MSYNESVLKELLDLIPQTGKLEWIEIRPGKKQALTAFKSVRIEQVRGWRENVSVETFPENVRSP